MKLSIISCNSNLLLDQICTFSGWNIHFSWWRSLVLLFSFFAAQIPNRSIKIPMFQPRISKFPFQPCRSYEEPDVPPPDVEEMIIAAFLDPKCYIFSVVEPQNFGSLNPLECKLRVQPHIFACLGSEIHMLNKLHTPMSSNIEENALCVYNLWTKNADYPAIEQEKVQPEPSRLGGALHKTCVPKKGDTMICAKGAIYDLNQQNRWSTDFGQLIPRAPSVSSNRQHVLPCFCDVCFLRDHEFQTAQGSCESCAGGRAMWCSLNSHHCLVQSWHRTWQGQATPPKTEAEGNQRTRFRH